MIKELCYVRFLQFSVLALTFVIIFGIIQAKNGNLSLHKKINAGVLGVTAIAVIGLVVTLLMGWDYSQMKIEDALINIGPENMKTRIMIHRAFSTPLFFSLIYTAYTGVKNMGKAHKKSIPITALFWLGTLITALLFF
ncbi:MAG: DUF420 domain-containing protein [Lentisphaeraceae bacterium]|nr:DUF420 domain-containing protein [Lentisphaeraceae bacterium]